MASLYSLVFSFVVVVVVAVVVVMTGSHRIKSWVLASWLLNPDVVYFLRFQGDPSRCV